MGRKETHHGRLADPRRPYRARRPSAGGSAAATRLDWCRRRERWTSDRGCESRRVSERSAWRRKREEDARERDERADGVDLGLVDVRGQAVLELVLQVRVSSARLVAAGEEGRARAGRTKLTRPASGSYSCAQVVQSHAASLDSIDVLLLPRTCAQGVWRARARQQRWIKGGRGTQPRSNS